MSTVTAGEVVVIFQILCPGRVIAADMIVSINVAVYGAAEAGIGVLKLQPIEKGEDAIGIVKVIMDWVCLVSAYYYSMLSQDSSYRY